VRNKLPVTTTSSTSSSSGAAGGQQGADNQQAAEWTTIRVCTEVQALGFEMHGDSRCVVVAVMSESDIHGAVFIVGLLLVGS
jgi:hypothetical protein